MQTQIDRALIVYFDTKLVKSGVSATVIFKFLRLKSLSIVRSIKLVHFNSRAATEEHRDTIQLSVKKRTKEIPKLSRAHKSQSRKRQLMSQYPIHLLESKMYFFLFFEKPSFSSTGRQKWNKTYCREKFE